MTLSKATKRKKLKEAASRKDCCEPIIWQKTKRGLLFKEIRPGKQQYQKPKQLFRKIESSSKAHNNNSVELQFKSSHIATILVDIRQPVSVF